MQIGHVLGALDLQDGEIAFLIGEKHLGGILAPVVELHPNIRRKTDHMIVRHHDSVLGQDHPRAERILHPRARRALISKEISKERITSKGAFANRNDPFGIDVDHRWGGLFDQGRKADGNLCLALGNPGLGMEERGRKGESKKRNQQSKHGASEWLSQ